MAAAKTKVKSPKSRLAETQIGKAVVQWLEEEGWDVYQEVPVDGHTPDVVGVRGSAVVLVECKTSFGLDVMAQARRWVRPEPKAHLVYIAVPQEKVSSLQYVSCRVYLTGHTRDATRCLGSRLGSERIVEKALDRRALSCSGGSTSRAA